MGLTRKKYMSRSAAIHRRARPMDDWRVKKPAGSRKRIKQDLHEVVSLIVRLRDLRCVLCGETDWQKLTAGHFYKRGWVGTAWDLRNVNCLCKSCNQRDNHDRNPHLEYMMRVHGTDVISELFEMRNSTRHIPTVELEELLKEMRFQLGRKR